MTTSKNELRIKAKTRSLSAKQVELLLQQIMYSDLFQKAEHISIYKHIDGEVPTEALIEAAWKAGKHVYIPHIEWNTKIMHMCRYHPESTLKVEKFGLVAPLECNPASSIDLAIIPCRMIARDGTRLGTGGGYYDRYLAKHQIPVRIGISMYPDTLDTLPSEAHDIKMTHMIKNGEIVMVTR